MLEQRLHWITLPAGAGADGATLRLSVFVAPRLRTDEADTLAPFPDLVDWPSRVLAPSTRFTVELSNGDEVPAARTRADPEPALWQALFSADTPLRPFVFDDFADRPIVSFSSEAVLGLLRRVTAAVAAAAPDALPTVRGEGRNPGLVDLYGEVRAVRSGILGEGIESGADLDPRITGLLADARAAAARRRTDPGRRGGAAIEPLPADGTATGELARLLQFHRRPGEPVDLPANRAEAARHFAEAVDFHQMLAALGDHPTLLRRLGLVIDLALPVAAVPDTGPFDVAAMRVVPAWESALPAGGAHADTALWTAYRHVVHDGERIFAAAQRRPDPAAPPTAPPTGLLPLPVDDVTVEQVDVDGAGLKALHLAATLDRVDARSGPADVPLGDPEAAGVPTFRTSGIALTRRGRAEALQGGFLDQLRLHDATEAGAAPWLWAEDLTRGYRLDVWDDAAGGWASLHRRTATYAVVGMPEATVDDEGMFQLSLAEPATAPGATPDPHAEVYVHERVVTWDGWSLAASRPGRDLGADEPERATNDPLTAMGLSIATAARAGTLPRLRFGRGYRLRVRTVDLAGNGPTLEEADRRLAMSGTDTPVVPATGSAVYSRFEPVPPPVLVPRVPFDEGSSMQRMVVRSSDAEDSPEAYAAAFNAAEEVAGGAHPPLRPHDERHVAPPKTSLQLVELHGLLDAAIGSDGQAPDDARRARVAAMYDIARREQGTFDDPTAPGARLVELPGTGDAPQRYVCHDVDDLAVPYLPDPLAWGVVLLGLPGMPDGEAYRVDVHGSSPHEGRSFRLRLAGGSAPLSWDSDARVLTVSLPQATSATVRISSAISGHEEDMGVLQWCLEALDPDSADRVLVAARDDRCWLLTPWLDLALVHAVQRPLAAPHLDRFEVSRQPADVTADVDGAVTVHVPSTERVDLLASWSEPVDDVDEDAPRRLDGEASVFSLPLADAEAYAGWGAADAPFVIEDWRDEEHAVLAFNTRAAWSLEVDAPASHPFGDTRHRKVAYRLRATTPHREYFPPAWAEDAERLARAGEPVVVDVPSSAPPATPQVATVVPTLGWAHDGAGVRRRRGGGLRVWLERPWYASGDGELLGVVIGSALVSPRAPRYPYVTLLARDPVRDGAPLDFATPATFRRTTATARARLLELDEDVDLACYAPTFDPGSRRWFCDVDLDTGDAYFPFVRLALVRYQAHALPGCHVSPVVLADVVQTLPDRTLAVTADASGSVRLALSGPTYTAIRGPDGVRRDPAALARVVATVERRNPRIADDVLGWQAVEGREVELAGTVAGPSATWSGDVDVSGLEADAARIRVVEYDHFASDPEIADLDGLVPRVVYADVVAW
jgi:hypothetical protein